MGEQADIQRDCGSLNIKTGFITDGLISLPGGCGNGFPPPPPLHLYIIFTC